MTTDNWSAAIEAAAKVAEQTTAYDDNLQKSAGCGTTGQRIAVCIRALTPPASSPTTKPREDFQSRVKPWLMECFGPEISGDRTERNHRFLEEALELVQSLGCTRSEARQLVDYTFDRPIGEPSQEAGGVMVTLAALCLANELDMHKAGETELERIWTKVEAIRAKQAAKPKHSPLPQTVSKPREDEVERVKAALSPLVNDEMGIRQEERG